MFQPIFDLQDGRVIAHEALARWTEPGLGPIAPSEFVPIAEQLNLIADINDHLMNMAFEEARHWPDHVRVSFNLSAVQFCSTGSAGCSSVPWPSRSFSRPVAGRGHRDRASCRFPRARDNLAELRDAGVTIVLDDFGAGFASIGYLRELRFDQIKLDGGLVTAARQSDDGKRLLRAVVGLRGSRRVEHCRACRKRGAPCSGARAWVHRRTGFWLSRPMSAEDLKGFTAIELAGRRLKARRAA